MNREQITEIINHSDVVDTPHEIIDILMSWKEDAESWRHIESSIGPWQTIQIKHLELQTRIEKENMLCDCEYGGCRHSFANELHKILEKKHGD